MKRLITTALTVALAIALAAVPVSAQQRGSGRSGGGSPSSMSRGGSPSHSSGSHARSGGSNVSSHNRSSAPSGNRSSTPSGNRSYGASPRSGQSGSAMRGGSPSMRGNAPAQRGGSPAVHNNGIAQRGGSPMMHGNGPAVQRGYQSHGNPGRVNIADGRSFRHTHPGRLEPMPYNRPARFGYGGPHYFGHRVYCLPPHYDTFYHWGVPYYCCDGLWYRMYAGSYYVCRPPFGHVFLPEAYGLAYGLCSIAYYYDAYQAYRAMDENAREIAAQNATIAANNALISQQNSELSLNRERAAVSYARAYNLGLVQSYADAGVEYYYDDGVFFTKGADGKYTVIVPPAGAVVQKLPDDYETVTIDGRDYCKVDDTVYEMTVIDGSACFQVLGQMTGDLAARYAPAE